MNNSVETLNQNLSSFVSTLEKYVKDETTSLHDYTKSQLLLENENRKQSDKNLNQSINNLDSKLDTSIDNLQKEIDDIVGDTSGNGNSLSLNSLNQSVIELNQRCDNISVDLSTEQSNRDSADKTLLTNIKTIYNTDGEYKTIKLDTLNGGALFTEMSERKQSDGALTQQLNKCVDELTKRDSELDKAISNVNEASVKLHSDTEQKITGSNLVIEVETHIDNNNLYTNSQEVLGDIKVLKPNTTMRNTSGEDAKGSVVVEGSLTVGDRSNLKSTEVQGDLSIISQSGNVSISDGKITTTGDVMVNGDLYVVGKSITEEHEVLTISDNVIVTRSGATSGPTSPSGLVINLKTIKDDQGNMIDNESMAIVYDPTTDSVNLSTGKLSKSTASGNEFEVQESNPIVIRPDSANISDSNFIMWEKKSVNYNGQPYVSVKAVDSGISKDNYTQLTTDVNTLSQTMLSNDNSLSQRIDNISNNISTNVERLDGVDAYLLNTIQGQDGNGGLKQSIADEILNRIDGDDSLQRQITSINGLIPEIRATISAIQNIDLPSLVDSDKSLQESIESIVNIDLPQINDSIENNKNDVIEEIGKQIQSLKNNELSEFYSSVDNRFNSVNTDLQGINGKIEQAQSTLQGADQTLAGNISALESSINSEYSIVRTFYDRFYESAMQNLNRGLVPKLVRNDTQYDIVWTVIDDGILG